MHDDERRTLVLALTLAGHGLHPEVPILLARRYLGAPLLPGTVVTDAMVAEAEAAVTATTARPLVRQRLAALDEETPNAA